MSKGPTKKGLNNLEKFQIVVGIIISIGTALIGWKTYELNEKVADSNAQLKSIEQQLAEAKFGFERVRDIYDRMEKYLASEKQDERRGRALVALVGTLPNSQIRSDMLSVVIREAIPTSVAAKAADIQQNRDPAAIGATNPNIDRNSFFGKINLRFDSDNYTAETLEAFGFVDSNGVKWEVPKGTKTDGASIPRAMWSIIGSPFSGEYIASSILHEYHSTIRTRSSDMVNRMFYESLLKSGVSEVKATLLYNAIKQFGPKWSVAQQ